MLYRFFLLLVFFTGLTHAGLAQTERERPLEIGVQFTALRLSPLGEGAGAVGGRASYDLGFRRLTVAPEVEVNYFPQNPSGNFGETQLLAGARAGAKIDQFGFFLKLRPGVVHFGGGDFVERNGSSTNFAMDAGAVFEYYISRRVALRVDWGDTMIYFPQAIATGGVPAVRPAGWYHNLQGSGGVNLRF
jgi:hypothetical protein